MEAEIEFKKIMKIHNDIIKKEEKNINLKRKADKYIEVYNFIDFEIMPKFNYINDCFSRNIFIPNDPLIGCDCLVCDQNCSCGEKKQYVNGLLKIKKGSPIYECNSRCRCGPECPKRVVQNGSEASLAIFKTSDGRGWGLRTNEVIKKGQFVTKYVGELISTEESDRRIKQKKVNENFMFGLDFNKPEHYPYTIDATESGNESRFINHSCDPNLNVYAVFINCLDPDIPTLALFAAKKINPLEELTFDYFNSYNHGTSFFEICKCGSRKCKSSKF